MKKTTNTKAAGRVGGVKDGAMPARVTVTPKLLARVKSLGDLRQRALTEPRYLQLALTAASNLGGRMKSGLKHLDDPSSTDYAIALNDAMRWLATNANETGSERGVVEEVNFVRDLVK